MGQSRWLLAVVAVAALAAGCSSNDSGEAVTAEAPDLALPPPGLGNEAACTWDRTTADVQAQAVASGTAMTFFNDVTVRAGEVWAVGAKYPSVPVGISPGAIYDSYAPENVNPATRGVQRADKGAATVFGLSPSDYTPLVARIDGTVWRPVEVEGNGLLEDVATTDSSVWAVGTSGDSVLIATGDVNALTPVDLGRAKAAAAGFLRAVAAVAEDDVWAVGFRNPADDEVGDQIVIERWDGKTWERQTLDDSGPGADRLFAVDASGPGDVWAVGSTDAADGTTRPLAFHWDGKAWSRVEVPLPSNGATLVELQDVAVKGKDSAVAVGRWWARNAKKELLQYTFAATWDGKTWTSSDPSSPGILRDRGDITPPLGPVATAVVLPDENPLVFGAQISANLADPAAVLARGLGLSNHGHTWAEVELPEAADAGSGDRDDATDPGPTEELLLGADSAGEEVWAVGLFGNQGGIRPVALHGTCTKGR